MALKEFERLLKEPSTKPRIYWKLEEIKGEGKKITGKVEYKIRFWPPSEKDEEEIVEAFVEAEYTLPGFTRKQKKEFEKILEESGTQYVRKVVKDELLKGLGLKKIIRFPISDLKQKEAEEIIRKVNDLFGFPQY